MKKITFTLILFFAALAVKSQTTYISSDDEALVGINLKSGTDKQNAEYITRIKAGKEVKLTPDDISTYGLDDGRKYVAKESKYIDKEKVFLELLEDGDFKLFYYAGKDSKIYLYSTPENDDLKPLKRELLGQFKEDLNKASDCDEIDKALPKLNFNRNSLIRFFRGLNSCNFFPYHGSKVGFNVGLSQLKLVEYNLSNRYLSGAEFNYSYGISYGLFVELPLNLMQGKIISGINFVSHKIEEEFTNLSGNVETDVRFTTLNIPLYIKHSLRNDKMFRPYYLIGFTFDHLVVKKNNIKASPRVINSGGVTVIQRPGEDASKDFMARNYYGIIVGIGAEYNIDHTREVRTEIQYSFKNAGRDYLSISSLNYSISYIF